MAEHFAGRFKILLDLIYIFHEYPASFISDEAIW
jgi:hypothetical protein